MYNIKIQRRKSNVKEKVGDGLQGTGRHGRWDRTALDLDRDLRNGRRHTVEWDGRDSQGRQMSSGVYLSRMIR